MEKTSFRQVHLIISGRVQAVCYRAETKTQAERLGVTGWVKNLPDGRVETVAEGTTSALNKFHDWCKKGPTSARVDNIEVRWNEAKREFTDFKITW